MPDVVAGERITVVIRAIGNSIQAGHSGIVTDVKLDTIRAEVSNFHKRYSTGESFRYQTSWASDGTCRVDDEGRTWIRGWPEKDDPRVLALLTAYTLCPDAMDLHKSDLLYTGGSISFEEWKANLDLWEAQEFE